MHAGALGGQKSMGCPVSSHYPSPQLLLTRGPIIGLVRVRWSEYSMTRKQTLLSQALCSLLWRQLSFKQSLGKLDFETSHLGSVICSVTT